MRPPLRRIAIVSLPAGGLAVLLAILAIEAWVRVAWDVRQGQPRLYVADPVRGQRLSAGYSGWFAGVPVRINQRGFRDAREYSLAKSPTTVRILVLGDSVTFGHGSVYESTYPYLLEQQLHAWRPTVDWQVWNLGVPGYNTRQELAYLTDVAAAYAPDLVVIGFFPNDVANNGLPPQPGALRRTLNHAASFVRSRWYSAEWYRRTYLTLRWRLIVTPEEQRRLSQLEDADLAAPGPSGAHSAEQLLTPFETAQQASAMACPSGSKPGTEGVEAIQREAGWPDFVDAVRDLQEMHTSGAVRLVFFLNMAPPVCPDGDFFYDGGSSYVNQLFLDVMGRGTPAVSSYQAFLPLRPSQMPNASGHSLGNSNLVKASVLSRYLQDSVLPALLDPQGRP